MATSATFESPVSGVTTTSIGASVDSNIFYTFPNKKDCKTAKDFNEYYNKLDNEPKYADLVFTSSAQSSTTPSVSSDWGPSINIRPGEWV